MSIISFRAAASVRRTRIAQLGTPPQRSRGRRRFDAGFMSDVIGATVNTGRRGSVPRDVRTYLTDALRGLAAAGAILSAVVHLDLYEEGYRRIPTIGPLFLVSVVSGLVLGVGVLVWRHWLPAFFAAGFGAVTVVFYWISVIHGLFGVKEITGGWPEITAEVAEYAAVVFGLAAAVLLFLEAYGDRLADLRRRRRRAAVDERTGHVLAR
jgi:hypothetical protein